MRTDMYKGIWLGLLVAMLSILAIVCYGYFKGVLILRIDSVRMDDHKLSIEYSITNYGLNTQLVLSDDNYFSATSGGSVVIIKVGANLDSDLIQVNKFMLPKIVPIKPLHSISGKLEIDAGEIGISDVVEKNCIRLLILGLTTPPNQNMSTIAQYNSFVEMYGRWIEGTTCSDN